MVAGSEGRIAALARLSSRPAKDQLSDLYVSAAAIMIPLTIAAHALLPPRFSSDSATLQRVATGEYQPLEDTSYLYVGRLYAWLGMAERPWAATVLGIGLAIVGLYVALRRARGAATVPVYLLVGLYVMTASVYLGIYSKDVWALLVVLVVLLAAPGWRGELAIIATVCSYAYFLRSYWFLVLLIYLGLRLLTAVRLHRSRVLVGLVVVLAAVTVLSPIVLGTPVQDIRESVNLSRLGTPDASTAIWAPEFGLGQAGDVVENAALLAGLVVPVDLLRLGSPEYALYFLVIVSVWAVFARSVFFGRGRIFDGRPTDRADPQVLRAALLAVAFVTTQGFFEPDYGSYLRHLTPVLLLIIVAVVGHPGSVFMARDRSGGGVPGAPPPGR